MMASRTAPNGGRRSTDAWLAEPPCGWPVRRLRFCATVNPSRSEVNGLRADTEVSFVPMDAVREYGGLRLDQTRSLADVATGYTYFREGDVLVAKITPCFENGKGSIAEGLRKGLGFGTTELHVLRPLSALDRRFLFYVTISHSFRSTGTAYMYGAGGQKRVPDDFVRDFRHPIPPLDEQCAIVQFLDCEAARIDALIEKKHRQIELLQEKRAALISHIVTEGLDPNAPMKEAGLSWLDAVPAHWEIKRLKFASTLQTGLALGKKYADRRLVARPYLRVANVQDGYLDLETVTVVELPPEEAARYQLEPGDVLMTEGGDFDKLGRGYVWEGQIPGCLHQNHIFAVRPDTRILNPHFLAAVMASSHGKSYFTSTSQQTTNLATTNSTKLGSFPVPLPPVAEQAVIVERVKKDSEHLDRLIGKINRSIDRLNEYRTSLISAAVTGKIDVRKEAP